MASSKQTDRATAQITDAYVTPEQKLAVGDKYIAAVKASKELKKAPAVETAAEAWEVANEALRGNQKSQADKRAELTQLEVDEGPLVRRWNARRRGLLAAVEAYSDGSKDLVNAFGLASEARARVPVATVPQDLRPKKNRKPNEAAVIWMPTPGAEGYLVQVASDPKDPATYSAEMACSQSKFGVPNQALGTIVHFRVLALDPELPNGKSAYTDWVAVVVRD